jgi:hypothetical protein
MPLESWQPSRCAHLTHPVRNRLGVQGIDGERVAVQRTPTQAPVRKALGASIPSNLSITGYDNGATIGRALDVSDGGRGQACLELSCELLDDRKAEVTDLAPWAKEAFGHQQLGSKLIGVVLRPTLSLTPLEKIALVANLEKVSPVS